MIEIHSVGRNSINKVVAHNKQGTKRHAADHDFLGKKVRACAHRPFKGIRVIAGHYETDGSHAHLITEGEFWSTLYVRDRWGRQRKRNLAFKVICSPTDVVQGYLVALEKNPLQQDLFDLVQECIFRDVFVPWGRGCRFYFEGHIDTTRFHFEGVNSKYGTDGVRVRKAFVWDRPWLNAIACRRAAGLPEDRPGPRNPRWNTIVGMQLEKDLIALCREFYRVHGLDEERAKAATARLQATDRAGEGLDRIEQSKKRARDRAEQKKLEDVMFMAIESQETQRIDRALESAIERAARYRITASEFEAGCHEITQLAVSSGTSRGQRFLESAFLVRGISGCSRNPDIRPAFDEFIETLGAFFGAKNDARKSDSTNPSQTKDGPDWDDVERLLSWSGSDLEKRLNELERVRKRWREIQHAHGYSESKPWTTSAEVTKVSPQME